MYRCLRQSVDNTELFTIHLCLLNVLGDAGTMNFMDDGGVKCSLAYLKSTSTNPVKSPHQPSNKADPNHSSTSLWQTLLSMPSRAYDSHPLHQTQMTGLTTSLTPNGPANASSKTQQLLSSPSNRNTSRPPPHSLQNG